MSRSAKHRPAQFDRDVAERSAIGRGLDEKRRLARFPGGLREARDGIVDACRREVDFDLRAGAGQRRLELDGERPGQPRAEIEAALGASGRIEGESYGRRPFLARRAGDVHMGRGAEQLSVAHDLQCLAVGLERGRRQFELLVGEKLLDLEIVERSARVELRILRARGLSELEIEDEIAFRLPFDGRGIKREPAWRRNGSRIRRSASASAVPVMCAFAEASTMALGVVSGTVKARLFACTRRDGDSTIVA